MLDRSPRLPLDDANMPPPRRSELALTPEAAERQEAPLVEGRDWYREGPAVVFTAVYLARRGWCCGNGCRHCPYGDSSPAEGSGESP
jgi:hypothetical protein